MLFFDYEKVFLLTGGNIKWMLPKFFTVAGYDFIKNPQVLNDTRYSLRDRVEYAGLCALRNYEDYIERDVLHLDKDLIPPWIPEQVYAQNKLIKIHKNHIELLKEN